jgi:enamine deaminase RidA (YjgF/YER057c/UK114 family)
VHAHPSGRPGPTTNPATTVRRFHGPLADQLFVLCRPSAGAADPARQAESVYEALRDALASEHVAPEAIVTETVFCRRIRDDVAPARSARSRVLGDAGLLPATTFIGQPPLADGVDLELAVVAVVPRSPEASAYQVRQVTGCACEGCAAGVCARVVRLRDQTSLWVGNVYGSGRDAFGEAYDMFRVAEDLLARAGMRFGDVMRTWIHVRDIDRDYDALNEARTKFFRDRGIERLPASTGVQGIPASDAHDFSLSLYALRSDRPLDIDDPLRRSTSPGLRRRLLARPARRRRQHGGAIRVRHRERRRAGRTANVGISGRRSTACCTTSRPCSTSRAPDSSTWSPPSRI